MAKTYNGRFQMPDEPKGGTGLLVGLGVSIFIVFPIFPPASIAICVACLLSYRKRARERRIFQRFQEFCALIGMRERVPLKELAKVGKLAIGEVRRDVQQMVARGFFGEEARLDVERDELVVPLKKEEERERGWRDVVFDLLDALRGERRREEPEPEPEPQPEAKPEPQPQPRAPQSAPERRRAYADEMERTLNELYQLNQKIDDEGVSRRIDRIGTLTAGIFQAVIQRPEREQEVRRFMNYYLPTTLKLLKAYDMMEDQSYQGENIQASRAKIESVLDTLIAAYEKLLDRLFHNDALDIATDIDVLEAMVAGDGLSEKGRMQIR